MRMANVLVVLAGLLLLPVASAMAAGVSYEGCTDSRGQKVQSVQDLALPAVVQSARDVRGAIIRYNPTALPRLGPQTHLFLYAQACAALNLGYPAGTALTLAQARRADCWGATTLSHSGLVAGPEALAAIQAELALSDEEWTQVPGPKRAFDLGACRDEALRMPDASVATSNPGWDGCVHRCGDRLYRCGRSDACMSAFEQCTRSCEALRTTR